MVTQSQLDQAVTWLINNPEFVGKKFGNTAGQYVGQCTSVIDRFLAHLGIPRPYMANNRGDGWGVSFPAELAPYFTLHHYQPGVAYPRGSIMMWDSPHIAVVLSCDGSNKGLFFQMNADPDGAPAGSYTRTITTASHHANYVLTFNIESPAPAGPPYHVIATYPEGRKVTVNKSPTTKWGMNFPDFDTMNAHPILTLPQGTLLTMVEALQHNNGQKYYREAGNVDGYNVEDCTDYVEPAKPAPPAAPAPVPLAETTDIVGYMPPYDTYEDAIDAKSTGRDNLEPGKYFVFEKKGRYWKIAKYNQDPGAWVDMNDNVEPVELPPAAPVAVVKPATPSLPEKVTAVIKDAGDKVVELADSAIPDKPDVPTNPINPSVGSSWKSSYRPFNASRKPVRFRAINEQPIIIQDLDKPGVRTVILPPYKGGEDVILEGKFLGPDGVWYGRTPAAVKAFNYYGIPLTIVRKRNAALETVSGWAEQIAHELNGLGDQPHIAAGKAQKFWDIIERKFKK